MKPKSEITIALLTGGIDRPYAFGLSTALGSEGVALDILGSSELNCEEIRVFRTLRFIEMYGNPRRSAGIRGNLARYLGFYWGIAIYTLTARAQVFHILWNFKAEWFDRTFLMLYYKLLGKKVVLTAHNVDTSTRDGSGSYLHSISLKCQYRLCDHIFVHTEKMKHDLVRNFSVRSKAITVIPFGVNNSVPVTSLTSAEAKIRVGFGRSEKVILFFGRIRPYKGLDLLIEAFRQGLQQDENYRLIIAGEPKKGSLEYWKDVQGLIKRLGIGGQILEEARFIGDEETELYFKAADVLVLPYTEVFQSGVLFLAYSFGLPVIAADVGSLREDIVSGETGFTCKPNDSEDLAKVIGRFFQSELYMDLDRRRDEIKTFVERQHSWKLVSDLTCKVYAQLLDFAAGSVTELGREI